MTCWAALPQIVISLARVRSVRSVPSIVCPSLAITITTLDNTQILCRVTIGHQEIVRDYSFVNIFYSEMSSNMPSEILL